MQIVIAYKSGTTESFGQAEGLCAEGNCLDIFLTKKIIRPPDKHPICQVDIRLDEVKEIRVINEWNSADCSPN